MIITSIVPAIKVVKENNIGGVDIYIALGDKIKIKDANGCELVG